MPPVALGKSLLLLPYVLLLLLLSLMTIAQGMDQSLSDSQRHPRAAVKAASPTFAAAAATAAGSV